MNKYLFVKMMTTPPSEEYIEVFLDEFDEDFLNRHEIDYSPSVDGKYKVSNIGLRGLLSN